MSKIVGIVGGKGNTVPSPKKQDSVSKRWCFTHHITDIKSEDALIKKLVGVFKSLTSYFIFSIEIGSETKKRHIQGYVEWKTPRRLTACKVIIDNTTHWEKSKGNKDDNITYCSKEPIKGPFTYENSHRYTAEELGLITEDMLFDWQKDIINIVNKKPEKRKIYWFWSEKGEIGKTEFVKYLIYHYGAEFIQGKKADIMCAICGKDGKKEIKKTYILGFSRTVEDYISYDAIETIKDGLLFSSKYESGSMIIPVPHVFIFCNFPPNEETMSKDRWVIKQLDNAVKSTDENWIETIATRETKPVDKFSLLLN